jgi:hypothetical protein
MLKGAMCPVPILAYPTSREFHRRPGASNFVTAGVLFQVEDGQERVRAYYSKTLNKAEIN